MLLLDSRDEDIENLRYLLWAAETEATTLKEQANAKEPEIQMQKQPLYLSEQQEDIQYQFDNDLINLKTYEALLKELEFENSEIQLADEYSVENYHY